MDNHDMTRFTRDILINRQDPIVRWKLALTYLYTAPGIPIMYYGSEIALDGAEDPGNRRMMAFDEDQTLTKHISKLGALRNKYPALTRGDLEVLHDESGMAVFKRTYKDETIVIAINNTTEKQTVSLDEKVLPLDMELKGLMSNRSVKESKGKYSVIMDAEESEIFSVSKKEGLNFSLLGTIALIGSVLIGIIIWMWRRFKKT